LNRVSVRLRCGSISVHSDMVGPWKMIKIVGNESGKLHSRNCVELVVFGRQVLDELHWAQ
jgi:hypothetical protein